MKPTTKHKLWKCTQGAISILLACLMMPFFSLAAILVEAGRYQSGVRALDQALGSSSISALANFDSYLLDRFGLLAVKQSSANVDEDLTNTVNGYLSKQQTTDLKAVELTGVTANGVYPLADTSVLKQQLTSSMNVLAPTKFILEGADIESLISQLEKSLSFLNVINQLSDGVKMLDKEAKMLEALDDAKDLMKETQKVVEAYETKFTEWQDAVLSLIDHLATDRPDPDAHPIKAGIWDQTKSSRLSSAETAQQQYSQAIQDLISAFNTLHSTVNSAMDAKIDFESSVVSFSAESSNALIEEMINDSDDDDFKSFAKNMKSINSSMDQSGKTLSTRLKDALDKFSPESILVAVEGLIELKAIVDAYDPGTLTGSSSKPSESTYFIDNLENLTDTEALDEYIKESEEELDGSGLIEMIKLLVDIFNAFFNTEFMVDGELNVLIDKDYYQDNFGGLPSQKTRSATFSNPYSAEDEAKAKEILEMIDPDYNSDDPFGLNENTVSNKLQELIDSITTCFRKFGAIGDADGFIEKLKALASALGALINVVGKLISFVATLVKTIVTAIYGKFLICSYMAYNIPNRTNYTSGTGLTGYSYGKIPKAESTTADSVPVFGDIGAILSGGDLNYNFSGAELEYIIWGNLYEQQNIVTQFLVLLIIRILLNIPSIAADATMQGLASTLVGIIVVAAVFILESCVDVYVLVNGGDVMLVKDFIYFSPTGIPKLIEALGSITLSQATKNSIAKKASSAFGVEYKEPPATTPSKEKKPLIDTEKYKKGLLSLDYTQYSFLIMMLFGSEKTYLKRLTDIIQFEMTMKKMTDDATLSQTITGEYGTFDIDKAYTTLRISANGSLNQMLPFPSMSNGNVLEVDRVLYRGY